MVPLLQSTSSLNLKRRIFSLISISLIPSVLSLTVGLAMLQGIEHPWLPPFLLITLVLTPCFFILLLAFCLVLIRRLDHKSRDFAYAMNGFNELKEKNLQLEKEINNLSGMHQINMSAHIESFSDLLKSALSITHDSVGSLSHTLYMESRQQPGNVFPRAHIFWPQAQSSKDRVYLFFEEEIVLNTLNLDEGLELTQRSDSQDLLHQGRQVGSVESTATPILVGTDPEPFHFHCHGVVRTWQSRNHQHHQSTDHITINVPIFSQGTIIGVLNTTFEGQADRPKINLLQTQLRDFSRNFGQSLHKEQLYEQAIKDSLTGLYNKAQYSQQLNDHFLRCLRYQRSLTYIFLDIDHFKNINDSYGHLTGDMALKAVSKIMMQNIRQSDIAFRFGGEELCVLLPESSEDDGYAVAEKLRDLIEKTEFPTDKDFTIHFTASFGVASTNETMTDPSHLAQAADQAVYHAKRNGRNQVTRSSDLQED